MTNTHPHDATPAIAAKKAEQAANRERIATAITTLSARGDSVNVQSVAREAEVHANTVRRNPDLLREVVRLRSHPTGLVAPTGLVRGPTGSEGLLTARLLAAQAEVAELRAELTTARKAAHQALGTTGTTLTVEESARLQQETAELRVLVMDTQSKLDRTEERVRELNTDLEATREVGRGYFRDLNRVQAQLVEAERELTTLRARQQA